MIHSNRRAFLGTAAAALTAGRLSFSASDKRPLRMGLIGCGWYGMIDLKAAFQAGGVEFIALCDVDSEHLESAAKETAPLQGGRTPQTFKNYQDLLETPGLEAVIIATPPHWHALPFLASLAKGLDIYCEKPLCLTVREAQAMVRAMRRYGRVFQTGSQQRSDARFRLACELVRNGRIGKVTKVEARLRRVVAAARGLEASERSRARADHQRTRWWN